MKIADLVTLCFINATIMCALHARYVALHGHRHIRPPAYEELEPGSPHRTPHYMHAMSHSMNKQHGLLNLGLLVRRPEQQQIAHTSRSSTPGEVAPTCSARAAVGRAHVSDAPV
jgi:hypothetical protein